jgi:molybdate transport system substrate-binding protein
MPYLLIVFLSLFSFSAHAEKTLVAVASNFSGPAKAIVQQFEQKTGHKAVLSFGSTGKLFAQIGHGAPFDIFLAADSLRAQKTEQEGFAVDGSRFTYAQGRLALYSSDKQLVSDKSTLLNQQIQRIAIANPKTAPYGIAAIEIMKQLNAYSSNQQKLVMGENIAQTYQFVATQNAQLGFVALSQIIHHDNGSRWIVSTELYSPLKQDAVLLIKGKNNPAASAFIEFLQSDAAKAIIGGYGYITQ